MYKFAVIFALIAIAASARVYRAVDEPVPILKSESDIHPDGSYVFSFEGGDGTLRQETGTLKNPGQEDAFVAVVGSYKFINADGETEEVHYTADENGFVPEGGKILPSISQAARSAANVE